MKCMTCGITITAYQTIIAAVGDRLQMYEVDERAELCDTCHGDLSCCDMCGTAVADCVPIRYTMTDANVCPFCRTGENRRRIVFNADLVEADRQASWHAKPKTT